MKRWDQFVEYEKTMRKGLRLSEKEMSGAKFFAEWLEAVEKAEESRFQEKVKEVCKGTEFEQG